MATQTNDTAAIIDRLKVQGGRILLGIDGYIDEVWQIIESRTGRDEYNLYSKMRSFSERLMAVGEGGFSNEIIRKRRTYGGFTANTGRAVSRLGIEASLLGMFGSESIDPVFAVFTETGKLISVGDPGISQIYEFADGKIMLPYIQEIMGFNWQSLTHAVDVGMLRDMFVRADIIAIGYWSLLPAFDSIVERICGFFEGHEDKGKRMFFDLADIRKRDRASLEETLRRLAKLNNVVPMTISLNEHEAELLYAYFGEDFMQDPIKAGMRIEAVRKKIGIDELVVHTPYFAAAASAFDGNCAVKQRYCVNPLITTGAGDNFNGGYMAAMSKGMPMRERLIVANAVTGLYVSNGYSPAFDELVEALPDYAACEVI